jgi:hypothetical protein
MVQVGFIALLVFLGSVAGVAAVAGGNCERIELGYNCKGKSCECRKQKAV